MSRLRFVTEDVALQKTNLIAANGRIRDVDIATESTNLAKYQVLVQASASMLPRLTVTPTWLLCFYDKLGEST